MVPSESKYIPIALLEQSLQRTQTSLAPLLLLFQHHQFRVCIFHIGIHLDHARYGEGVCRRRRGWWGGWTRRGDWPCDGLRRLGLWYFVADWGGAVGVWRLCPRLLLFGWCLLGRDSSVVDALTGMLRRMLFHHCRSRLICKRRRRHHGSIISHRSRTRVRGSIHATATTIWRAFEPLCNIAAISRRFTPRRSRGLLLMSMLMMMVISVIRHIICTCDIQIIARPASIRYESSAH